MRAIAAVLLLSACATTTTTPTLPTPPPPVMSEEARVQRTKELAAARTAHADALIWYGRRTAYLGNYAEAIDIFGDGIRRHPDDARMYRHRGHRWITLRQFDDAIRDLDKAASLVRGTPDQIEPDGLPNARNIPTSTLQGNIYYHLGLAHYLKGDFERALAVYQECMAVAQNPDSVVSTAHWLYMTLRRLGRPQEAERILQPISVDMDVIENTAYHKLLLMYRGEIAVEEMEQQDPKTVDGATILYGIGNWYLYNGQPERARPIFQRITSGGQWAAFGYIAAESELRRLQ